MKHGRQFNVSRALKGFHHHRRELSNALDLPFRTKVPDSLAIHLTSPVLGCRPEAKSVKDGSLPAERNEHLVFAKSDNQPFSARTHHREFELFSSADASGKSLTRLAAA